MDNENIPFDMNAVYAKERSHGFSLPNFITERFGEVAVISSITDGLLESTQQSYGLEPSYGKYRNEAETALKEKIQGFHEADLKVWETRINPAKQFGESIGVMLESALFSYAKGDLDSPNTFQNMMNIVANYFVLLRPSELDSGIIAPATGEVVGHIAARLYKQRSLKTRKRDLEDFLRSEGIIDA